MAKPFVSESAASSGGEQQTSLSTYDPIRMTWVGEESKGAQAAENNSISLFDNSDPTVARQRVVDEYIHSMQQSKRKARFSDQEPASRAELPVAGTTDGVLRISIVDNAVIAPETAEKAQVKPAYRPTNLEITNTKLEAPTDLTFAQLRQLAGPNSASSQWMASVRPDLQAQFQMQCALHTGSSPDGAAFEILTSPEGYRRMLTAKGSTTVEIITDPSWKELFRHSSRASATKEASLTA